MTHCEELLSAHVTYIKDHVSCRETTDRTWMLSPYTHVDGDAVEIAAREQSDGTIAITDLGESLRRLSNFGYDPRETANGRYLLAQITKQYRVDTTDDGMVYKVVARSALGEATHDVIAASLAIGNLIFLARAVRPATIHEEVAAFLDSEHLDYVRNERVVGKTGKRYTVDFAIPSNGRRGLIKAISSQSISGVTSSTNAAFRAWYDINAPWKATVIDDRVWPWRDEDVAILKTVSKVFRWSDETDKLKQDVAQFAHA